jgi:hypothetical protein
VLNTSLALLLMLACVVVLVLQPKRKASAPGACCWHKSNRSTKTKLRDSPKGNRIRNVSRPRRPLGQLPSAEKLLAWFLQHARAI